MAAMNIGMKRVLKWLYPNAPKPLFYRLTVEGIGVVGDCSDRVVLLMIAHEIYNDPMFKIQPIWDQNSSYSTISSSK